VTAAPAVPSAAVGPGAEDVMRLLKTAAQIVASRMTKAGHLAQVVTQEHRGNCRHDRCTPACIEAGDFMVAVDEWLTAHERPQPEQRGLWGSEVAG
jgi:hypothetical protein